MKEETKYKDFESGATSSDNLPPYECLTLTFLRRAAKRMELGMHYGKHNWKKGTRDKKFILDRLNHALEHLVKATSNIDKDIDGLKFRDDDLAAVVVNCMFAMEYQEIQGTDLSVEEVQVGPTLDNFIKGGLYERDKKEAPQEKQVPPPLITPAFHQTVALLNVINDTESREIYHYLKNKLKIY